MDGNSDKSGKTRDSARSSLVERAAAKIVADRGAAAPKRPDPARGPEVRPEPIEMPPLEPAEEAAVTEALAPAGAEPELLAAALDGQPQPEAPAPAAPAPQRRKSRMVKIDTTALQAKNILTPATKRNRTVEEFRLIKRMLLSRRWDHGDAPGNTIVVTSALPSEGKTTTAINLAMSIAAEEDLRVLLVDADFIKPDALRQLGVTGDKGLIDVIQDPGLDIADVILRTDIDKLSLIPAGQLHDRCTELLASARMDELIAELASRYEDRIIIFDSPPVLATTESVVLASHMGQVVFVVQAGRTKRESVDSALELLGERQNVGLVLNRSAPGFGKTEFGAYYGSYYYGHDGEKK